MAGSGSAKASTRGGVAIAALAGGSIGLASAVGGPALFAAGAGLGGLGLVLVGRRLPSLFLGALAALLAGYAFLDRGLAHAGVGFLYVGEAVLGLGVVALLVALPRVRIAGVEVVLGAFMAWGAFRTVPYIGVYGVDALRDAVQWGYAVFALLVIWLLDRGRIEALVRGYGRIVLPLALWLPVAVVLTEVFYDRIPAFPGSEVAFVYLKPGDAGVHLAGIAAFVLAGLAPGISLASEAALWSGWALTAVIVSALNRGAMLAAATTVLVMLFARKLTRWLALGAAGVLLLSIALIANPTVDVGGSRQLSVQQVVTNAIGIFGASDTRNQSTKEWRADWWGTIIDYTIHGSYFWTGKGFGINLANDDGFQVQADQSLRAPHSAHFEFLARGGVPMLALWIVVLLTFVGSVIAGARRAARAGDRFMLAVLGWLFVYWVAAVINMSVDVYLGGPQGGIPFWCVYGAGIATARLAGRRAVAPDGVTRLRPDPARAQHRPTPPAPS